jgi:hypothetical protein
MENSNQNSGSGQQTINIQVPSAENIANRRSLIPTMFAIVIVFFFFNFFTVKCANQEIGSVTGFNLVTGTELKNQDMFTGEETKGEKMPPNAWAIIAFGAAIIGLGAFLIRDKREAMIGTGAAVIGFGSLIILQFAIKNAIDQKGEGQLETSMQFGYWGALLAMGVAGFISYLRLKKTQKIIVNFTPPNTTPPTDENTSHHQITVNPTQSVIQKTREKYSANKGELELEIIHDQGYYPFKGDEVFIGENPAPDGKYKLGFLSYIYVKSGVIVKTTKIGF